VLMCYHCKCIQIQANQADLRTAIDEMMKYG